LEKGIFRRKRGRGQEKDLAKKFKPHYPGLMKKESRKNIESSYWRREGDIGKIKRKSYLRRSGKKKIHSFSGGGKKGGVSAEDVTTQGGGL